MHTEIFGRSLHYDTTLNQICTGVLISCE